jgi:DNA repair protein RecN (Recombination protein N)
LPQIASKGQQHLKIFKTEQEHTTETHVKILTPTERIHEIASMLSNGEITQKALENAAQLLQEHY